MFYTTRESTLLTKRMLAVFLGIQTLFNLHNGLFMSQLRAFHQTTPVFLQNINFMLLNN
jgi:hypothetical protein